MAVSTMRKCSGTCHDDVTESSVDHCLSWDSGTSYNDLSNHSANTNTCASISVVALQLDSATDCANAVIPLNIDDQPYKKLPDKSLFNDLSSHGAERVVSMVEMCQVQHVHVSCCEDKACQTVESSVRRMKLVRSLKRHTGHALCFAGWILCCPCWTFGFIMRDPPDYYDYDSQYHNHQHPHHHQQQQQQQQMLDDDDDSTTDPCWPCDNCVKRRQRRSSRRPAR